MAVPEGGTCCGAVARAIHSVKTIKPQKLGVLTRTLFLLSALGCHHLSIQVTSTDGQVHGRKDPAHANEAAMLASAVHDIPCPKERIIIVDNGSVGMDTATGRPTVLEGCGQRVTYAERCDFSSPSSPRLDDIACTFRLIGRGPAQLTLAGPPASPTRP